MRATSSRLALAAALALPLAIVPDGAARAATLIVTDLGDTGGAGQLRTLMNAAAPGDTIVVPSGKITLAGASGEDLNASGDLDVRKDVTIVGAGPGLTLLDGGGLDRIFDVLAPSVATISGMTIQNGVVDQGGGGGLRNAGTLTLSHVVVTSHQALKAQSGAPNAGGGIRNAGTLTGGDVVVQLNICEDAGGGIQNEAGATMTLASSTVRTNLAKRGGGGIANLGTLTLTGVTLSANNTNGGGGGIATSGAGAVVTIVDSTFYLNIASGAGGGLDNAATASLLNVTLAANTLHAAGAGAGIASTGTTTIENVLLGGNAAAGVEASCSGTITSLGHNLDAGTTCALAAAGDLSGASPHLGPFQDNGGPTATLALLPGSAAIDAGADAACPPVDQRGVARPQGPACDIGAYEAASIVLDLAPAVLPGATAGAAYAQPLSLVVTNGVPYTPPAPSFALSAGTLPAGLTLAATGLLAGTPTAAGTASFTVTATDANGLTASHAYTLAVAASTASPILDVAPAALPDATDGAAYAQTLTVVVTNGVAYTPPSPTFTVSAGTPPAGLALGSGGALAGVPAAPGTATFTVTATDGHGLTASRVYSLVVAARPPSPALDIAPAVLPAATQNAPYSHALTVVVNGGGYTPPSPTFAVSTGALPAGLSLAPGGALTGVPVAPGSTAFTVTATDSNGLTASHAYTLDVAAAPPSGGGGSPPPASTSSGGCGCGSASADPLGVLLVVIVAARSRRRMSQRAERRGDLPITPA